MTHCAYAVLCSQRDVQQLKSILCMPSLNPDIRRAAAEQLLNLAPDPRFTQALSDASLLHAIHHSLATACTGLGDDHMAEQAGSGGGGGDDAHAAGVQKPSVMPDMQLPIACLHLLGGIAQHCSEGRILLLQEADR